MEGIPTIPGKDPEIMSSGEIAIAKRREKLNELFQPEEDHASAIAIN